MKLSATTTWILFILFIEPYGWRFYVQLKIYRMVKCKVLKKSCSTDSMLVPMRTRMGGKGKLCFSVDTLLFYILQFSVTGVLQNLRLL